MACEKRRKVIEVEVKVVDGRKNKSSILSNNSSLQHLHLYL